jgi:sirohydrochlorin ferrochelatase
MTELACLRITEALAERADSGPHSAWGVVLMAHGTPLEEANAPLYRILAQLQTKLAFDHGIVAFLDCNTPTIADGIRTLIERNVNRLVTLPYFLHLGRHVSEDLPQIVQEAATAWPQVELVAANHLDYDLRLVQAIVDRLQEATEIKLAASPSASLSAKTRFAETAEKAKHS